MSKKRRSKTARPAPLRSGWRLFTNEANEDRPGIYEWRLACGCVYIGKYTKKSRPKGRYDMRVKQIEHGRPYSKKKADGFRLIHGALHREYSAKRIVHLTILENPPIDLLHARESELIRDRGCLNVPPFYGDNKNCSCALHHAKGAMHEAIDDSTARRG